MGVTTQHKGYQYYLPLWTKCRDSIEGNNAIKAATTKYLPKLTGQSDTKYAYYSSFGTFANYSARTLDALSGMVFAKNPQIELPAQMEEWAKDITKTGKTLIDFAEDVVNEQLATGRCGILIDYPNISTEGMSVADIAQSDIRPYPTIYTAESIINWHISKHTQKLELVVLCEAYEDDLSDEFTYTTKLQYRVLDLYEEEEGGAEYYRVRIFRDVSEQKERNDYQAVFEAFPTMNGTKMTEIPFIIVGVQSLGYEIQKPPLLDLVEVNISHYRFTVDYEYGAHKTGIPTPVITGHTLNKNDTIELGDTALVLDNPDAKAFFLEFEGKGMELIENLLKSKEYQMSVLGARMLADEKKATEAQGTLEIRSSGERSVLASIAKTSSAGITKALEIMRDWAVIAGDITFELNTDYTAKSINPQYITSLMGLWQGGAITQETLYNNLQKQEITDPQEGWEEYQTKLTTETPQMSVSPSQESTSNGILASIRTKMGL